MSASLVTSIGLLGNTACARRSAQNALKHSGATRYTVALRGTPEDVTLDVVDDGCGFDPESAMAGHGPGLVSIQERLSAGCDGRVSVGAPTHLMTTLAFRRS